MTAPTLELDTAEVFAALDAWIKQRPKLDPADYGCDRQGRSAYQSEVRSIGKDRQRALGALREARGLIPARPDLLADSFRAFSGRLEWKVNELGHSGAFRGRLVYTTGQYWPTEYRKAAASVLETYIAAWRQAQNAAAPQTFTYRTLADVKAANRAIGNHWFDRSTMNFFNTRIESRLIRGRYFVTSERYDETAPRKYTVRRADPDGTIDTEGEFQAYLTLDDALAFAQRIAGVKA